MQPVALERRRRGDITVNGAPAKIRTTITWESTAADRRGAVGRRGRVDGYRAG
jgi:hypothetical protein